MTRARRSPAPAGDTGRRGRAVALLVAAVLAGGCGVAGTPGADDADAARDQARRAEARDRLMGRTLPGAELPLVEVERADPRDGLDAPGWRLVWIVRPEGCLRCLDVPGPWNAATRLRDLRSVLVLSGSAAGEAEEVRRRAGLRGTVLADPGGSLVRALLPDFDPPPSLYLLVSPEGVVQMADARFAGTSCGWSFPRTVTRLFTRDPIPARGVSADLLSSDLEPKGDDDDPR